MKSYKKLMISKDCMVKLWNLAPIKNQEECHIDPYLTFREHTGPLFAMTGIHGDQTNTNQNILFTAGSEVKFSS
jgi:striatin 1/3/4